MSLAPGSHLGPYEIVSQLGAGGMGVVYLAHDAKLNRDVAIKVLPDEFTQDAERLARFEREAQVLAALNHPNTAQIYGMEGAALVMEYVPGDTLHGPLTLDQVMNFARQIAEALECAHEKGIVHRDLKPANIKVTPDGVVKVLDFGLAKAMEQTPENTDNSPTGMAVSKAGIILGTVPYMSPEQAAGRRADRRADIWAFGVVLWEMLSDRRLFAGETMLHSLSQVLTAEIDFSLLPPDTPAAIRELTERCLDRNLKTRLQSIAEARIAIEKHLAQPAKPVMRNSNGPPRRSVWLRSALGAALAVALAAVAALGVVAWRATRPAPTHPLARLNVEVGSDTVLARPGGNMPIALSPDGSRLAFTYRGEDGKVHLGTRLLQQTAVVALGNTEDASAPFFSPDGKWIGFFAEGQLKKISVDGAAITTLCAVRDARGASWGDDGYIVLAAGLSEPLSRVSSEGGRLEPLTTLKGGEETHRWPYVLPGSRHVLFTSSAALGNYDDASIQVVDTRTHETKTLQPGGISGRYLAGHLMYLRQSTLFAAPLELKSLALTGQPVPILEDVGGNPITGGDFAFSTSGMFVYLPGRAASSGGPIAWLNESGKREILHTPIGRYFTPRISPDGKRLAFAIGATAQIDIWVKNLPDGTLSRLTFLGGENRYPVWTPDGRNIFFESKDPKSPGIYAVPSDGSGEARRLTDGKFEDVPFSFTPDGKRLAFHRFAAHGSGIWTAPVEGDAYHPQLGKAERFFESPFLALEPSFSPDGHWLAYASNDTGTPEVYVRSFPGPGGKWQISTGGGHFAAWSRAGHRLFFEKLGDPGIMAATYTTKESPQGETFSAGTPRLWSAVPLIDSNNYYNYDLAPDGKRIAALLAPEDAASQKPLTHVTFLLNFLDVLGHAASTAFH